MTNLMTLMTTSISEVMETMFYLPVEPRDTLAFNQVPELCDTHLEGCQIRFSGPVSGQMILAVPTGLLAVMTENFMGESKENLTLEHLTGTVSEALNMIAGKTLSKIEDAVFDLGIPEAVSIPGSYAPDVFKVIETVEGFLTVAVVTE